MKKSVSGETMDAMKRLLVAYETNQGLTTCPLCKMFARSFYCTNCPWTLFGHKKEAGFKPCTWYMHRHFHVVLTNLRCCPSSNERARQRRINMLRHWIRNCYVD